MFTNDRGQALLESLVSLPVVTSGVICLFSTLYFILAHFMLEHWAYQATLCLAQEYPREVCRKRFLAQTAHLSFHQVENLQLVQNSYQVRLQFRANSLAHSADYRLSLSLPLRIP